MSNYPNATPYASAPPPIGFAPPPHQTVHTTTVITTAAFGETPKRMICPNCQSEVLTAVSTEYSLAQHIAFFVMCITGACCICSCVPYCIDSLGNLRHECPSCHSHLGTFNRCN